MSWLSFIKKHFKDNISIFIELGFITQLIGNPYVFKTITIIQKI